MIKVLFLTDNLGGGGAERVIVNLVNLMDKTRFDITVRTCFSGGVNVGLLDKSIKYQCKGAPVFHGIKHVLKFIPASILYRYFIGKNDYDVIIAYMNGNPTKTVSGAKGKKKLAWIHGDMMGSYKPNFPSYFISRKSMQKALKRFDYIVGVSERICDSFKTYTGVSENVILRHNTNDVEKILQLSKEKCELPFEKSENETVFVSVGSLVEVKGFERLIACAKKLKEDGFKFKVVIIGEGRLRENLTELIDNDDLNDTVFLIGFHQNPYKYLSKCDVFVCSSYSEGLSTAVSEAVILGLPCISTEVSGAREILGKKSEYGIIAENTEDGIYIAMKNLLQSKENIRKYAELSAQRASFFSPERTVGEIEKLIEDLVNASNS